MAINQLKAGAVLSYVAIGLNNIVGLLYTPYMLRMLGQNEYGLYSLVASVVSYLTVLDLGFANAIIRYTAKYRAERKVEEQYNMFGMFFILYCIIGFVAFIIGLILLFNVDVLFDTTMNKEDIYKIQIMMLLMILNLSITFPMSIWGAIITAYENFVFQKLVNIARIILNPLVMVLLLSIGYKAITMVVVITLFNIMTLFVNAWYCKSKLDIKILFNKFDFCFLKEVSVYSFWIFLNIIMDRIYWSTGQFILGMFVGASAVAVYAVAIQLQHIYLSFSTAIAGVFLPKVTTMVTECNSSQKISDLFIKTGRIQYLIMAFILTGFILFGKQFILFWAGGLYEDVYYIALLFFVPLTVPLIQNIGITILQAQNKMKFRSLLYISIAMLSLIISIPLAKTYSGIGCAIGTSIALIIGHIIIMNIYYYKEININIPLFWKEILKMSYAPVFAGTIAWIVLMNINIDTIYQFIMIICLFSVFYITIIWFGSMNSYEKTLFSSPIVKFYHKFQR